MCSINHELKAIFIHTPKCGGLFTEFLLEKYYGFKTYYFTHENHDNYINLTEIRPINYYKNLDSTSGFLKITKEGVLRYFMSSINHNNYTNMTNEKWLNYTKFVIVRNPYDRFVSSYKYILDKQESYKQESYKQESDKQESDKQESDKQESDKQESDKQISLNEYICNKDIMDEYSYFHSFISQYENLINIDGKLEINHIIHFENLNKELCDVLLKIGVKQLKHRNAILTHKKYNSSNEQISYCKYYDKNAINLINNIFEKDFEVFNFKKVSSVEELEEDSINYYKTIEQFEKDNIQLLIELDSKNLINKSEELKQINSMNNVKTTNNRLQQIDIPVTIQLDNNIKLEVVGNSIVNTRPKFDAEFHFNNFLKILDKHYGVDKKKK